MDTKKRKKGPLQQTIKRRAKRGSRQDAIHVMATTTSGIAKSGLIPLKAKYINVERRTQVVIQVVRNP
jgi:hypothetical protein